MQKTQTTNTFFHQKPFGSTHPAAVENQTSQTWSDVLHNPLSLRKIPTGASKRVIEGVVPALLLIALTLVMDLMIYPIQASARNEGLLIYFFITVILGVIALDRSTVSSRDEVFRAVSGMIAAQFFWHSLLLIQIFTNINLGSIASIMILVLITWLGFTLWRPVLPLGVKFFFLAFLTSWFTRILLVQILVQARLGTTSAPLYYFIGFLAAAGLLFGVCYLIFRASYKIYRIWTALGLWQIGLIGLSIAFGILY